jgi:hypothetical protein
MYAQELKAKKRRRDTKRNSKREGKDLMKIVRNVRER